MSLYSGTYIKVLFRNALGESIHGNTACVAWVERGRALVPCHVLKPVSSKTHFPVYIEPILVANVISVGVQVYDMSYGGVNMYGPGRSYNLFAGRDASVALAKVRRSIFDVLAVVGPIWAKACWDSHVKQGRPCSTLMGGRPSLVPPRNKSRG